MKLTSFFISITLLWCVTLCNGSELRDCMKAVAYKYFNMSAVLTVGQTDITIKTTARPLIPVDFEPKWLNGDWTRIIFHQCSVLQRNRFGKMSLMVWVITSKDANVTEIALSLRFYNIFLPRTKVLIVFLVSVNRVMIRTTLLLVWKLLKILNTTIVTEDGGSILFHSFFPYHGDFNVSLIDIYREGNFQNGCNVFPNKLPKDFKGNDLIVTAYEVPPYVIAYQSSIKLRHGVEALLVETLAGEFGFNLKMEEPPPGENPKMTYDNAGNVIGLASTLYEHKADIAIAGFAVNLARSEVNDLLSIHTEDALVWLIPNSIEGFDGSKVWDAFSFEVWILHFSAWLAMSIYLSFICHSNYSSALINAWAIILEQPFCLSSCNTVTNLLFGTYVFCCLVLTASYRSVLFKTLTASEDIINFKSPEEVVNAGWITYLVPSGEANFNQTDFETWNKILIPSNHIMEQNHSVIIHELVTNKKGMTLINQNAAYYLINRYYATSNGKQLIIKLKKEKMYTIGAYIAPGHPLTSILARKIRRITEAGLIELWMKLTMSYARFERFWDMKVTWSFCHQPLTMNQVIGSFGFLFYGHVISFCVFLLEMAKSAYDRKSKMHKLAEKYSRDDTASADSKLNDGMNASATSLSPQAHERLQTTSDLKT